MTDPATHYHHIETADELASEKQDYVMYYLTKLEGQLERMEVIIVAEGYRPIRTRAGALEETVASAKAFAQSLRNAIESTPQ